MHGTTFWRLEDVGPANVRAHHTSNRAELRAVVCALGYIQHKDLYPKKIASLVIATDSTYVIDGGTAWSRAGE